MKLRLTFLVLGLLSFTACGSGTDPYTLLGDPYQTPTLSLPVAITNVQSVTGYNAASQDGFAFLSTNVYSTLNLQSIYAPAAGVVMAIESDGTTSSITIMHNSRFSSRLSRLPVANLAITARVGDTVTAGQVLGTVQVASNQVITQLSVIVNGGTVCPESYLNTNARTEINSKIASTAYTPLCI